MANKKNIDEDILRQLNDAMVNELLRKIREGEATAADLSVARQYLKDVNFGAVPDKHQPTADLGKALPFSADDTDPYGLPN